MQSITARMRERQAYRPHCAGVVAALLTLCLARGAQAQEQSSGPALVVEYGSTGLTLVAKSVPLRMVVGEWARLGGVQVVSLENVVESPVTVDLREVPEAAALKVLLRGLPGYVLRQRAQASAGRSAFDRLFVMKPPSSSGAAMADAGGLPVTTAAEPTEDPATDVWSPPPGAAPPADGGMPQPAAADRAARPSIPGQPRPGPMPKPATSKGPGAAGER